MSEATRMRATGSRWDAVDARMPRGLSAERAGEEAGCQSKATRRWHVRHRKLQGKKAGRYTTARERIEEQGDTGGWHPGTAPSKGHQRIWHAPRAQSTFPVTSKALGALKIMRLQKRFLTQCSIIPANRALYYEKKKGQNNGINTSEHFSALQSFCIDVY